MIRSVIPLALAGLLTACTCTTEPSRDEQAKPSPSEPAPAERAPAPDFEFNRDSTAFDAALAELDETIAKTEERAAAQAGSWLALEKVAGLWLRRARLSGSYDDYAKAEDALTRAFARADEGTGPFLTRAALNFTLHRLDAVDPDLDKIAKRPLLDDPTRAVVESMRGDLAFARGQYDAARERFDAALALDRTPSILAKLALWHWRMGEFDQAEARYLEAEKLLVGDALEPRAWTHLQLGIMDLERGRYEDAFAHYRDGAAVLGGWWLLDEHIAEITALLGQPELALALYDDIIARTGKAEFIDAKAGLLTQAGDAAGSAALVERATEIYEAELKRFPEASYGHALDHFLEFGPPARALELAEANHTLRPNVEAKLGLAQARLGAGDVAGAKAIVAEALASKVVLAELYWVASQVHAAAGEADQAATLRAKAEAINPRVAE